MGRHTFVLAAACALLAQPVSAGKPHEHGLARLDIGVEASAVRIQFEAAAEGITGFERAPRTDAERSAVATALARLRDAQALFRIDPGAGCAAGRVEVLVPPAWTGAPVGPAAKPVADHADLDASYEFSCSAGAKAAFVEVGLFEAFARLRRIEVQIVTPRGQMKAVLKPGQRRVTLVR